MTVQPGRVGLGGAGLGNLYEAVTDEDADATVAAAWQRGIRLFDTAPLYGHGLSEARLGRALADLPRDELVVCSKVGRVLVPERDPAAASIFVDVPAVRPEFDYREGGIERSLTGTLERLGMDRLDIVHVHDPDDHLDDAIAHAYPALSRWRAEGVCDAIGLGTNRTATAHHVLDAVDLDWLLLAGRYTLLDRSGASVLDRCAELGVGVIAAGAFNSGLLANPVDGAPFDYAPAAPGLVAQARRLQQLCASHGVPLAAAALQFPLRHPAVRSVLAGARSPQEVHADVDLLDHPIPAELWAALDS